MIFGPVVKQESEIRIYNVDNGWKVQKDIRAKSLRWTITDASLSPDQRLLVSYIQTCMHIVLVIFPFLHILSSSCVFAIDSLLFVYY